MRSLEQWNAHSVASLAFGQEIGVTVMQMATAFATVANAGVQRPPRLILGTLEASGHLHRLAPRQARRVISSRTAATLTDMSVTTEAGVTRIHVALDEAVDVSHFSLTDPARVFIDCRGVDRVAPKTLPAGTV